MQRCPTECCLRHMAQVPGHCVLWFLGSLLYFTFFYDLRGTWQFHCKEQKILIFSFWCSTAWKQHINICLDCITLGCLIFKFLCMLITWVSGNNLLNEFWHGIRVEILAVSVMTLNILLPFYTMHLCEVIFTNLTIMKSIYQLIMKNVEESLFLTVSNIQPRLNCLCKNKQTYLSY